MSKYTCDQLGVCQGDNPACQMCAIERETRRQAMQAEQRDIFDQIFDWLDIAFSIAIFVAVFCLLAGYTYQRLTQ